MVSDELATLLDQAQSALVSAWPPCRYSSLDGDATHRACSLHDRTDLTRCLCWRMWWRGQCGNDPWKLDPVRKPTSGTAGSGYYRRGLWRAVVVNWKEKGMPLALRRSMQALGWQCTYIVRGSPDWWRRAIESVERDRPQLLVTFQRLYTNVGHASRRLEAACRQYNCHRLVMDFGVAAGQAHYGVSIFDPQGENATSAIANGGFDRCDADPQERAWIDRALPQVEEIRRTLLERADKCPRELLVRYGLEELPNDWVLVLTQKTGDKVLVHDAHVPPPRELVPRLIARLAALGRYGVAKPHPFDPRPPAAGPMAGGLTLPKLGGQDNHLVSAWLLAHAAEVVTVNSTMLYQAMALDRPITCLGRGWFTGNGVVHEQDGVPLDRLTLTAEPPDPTRRRRFLALMLSRQLTALECEDPAKVEALLRRFERLRDPHVSSITCVYTPDDVRQHDAIETLEAIEVAGPRIAATDQGLPGWAAWCRQHGIGFVAVRGGRPPRLPRLLEAGLRACQGDLVWTVEQGTLPDPAAMRRAEEIMRTLPPDVASLALESVDAEGRRNFPSSVDIPKRTKPYGDHGLLEVIPAEGRPAYNTFNATLWRYHALARVDWSRCPAFKGADIEAGRQMAEAGYVHLIAPGLTARHRPHASQKKIG